MGKYWRLIGHYNGEAQTYEALAGTFQTSPYVPDEKCRLKGIRVIVGAEAATSLTEGVQYRLSCTAWKPNVIHVGAQGTGLQTVPCTPQGTFDWDLDQPCEPGVPITIEARHAVGTAVTHNSMVFGLFES